MTNLAVKLDPKTWDDYYFHGKQINHLRKFIKENNHPFAITVSGHTGSGKTTAVKLYIKSLLCLNRNHGDDVPCGECANCLADPRTGETLNNVIWVQQGQDEKISAQINKALEEASSPPYGLEEEHRHYKVIVFDELQSIPRNWLQALLFYPEIPQLMRRNRVIFVFITMDESKIDPSIFKPLAARTFYLRFRGLTEDEITEYLSAKFNNFPQESKEIISHYADGSIRFALSAYEKCVADDPNLSPISVAETLYYASKETRKNLWSLLQSRNWKELNQFWKDNSPFIDPEKLIGQLLRDLDNTLINGGGNDAHLKAKHILYSYLVSNAKVNAFDAIKMLAGFQLDCHLYIDELENGGSDRVFS
jgi:DNA polymerase III gamma/tau subunit